MSLLFVLQMQEFWNTGVLTAKTRCWAQGMDGWRPLQAIPQLKWCLLATGQAVMNESDLATLILNMLITMCSYYPSRWAVCPVNTSSLGKFPSHDIVMSFH